MTDHLTVAQARARFEKVVPLEELANQVFVALTVEPHFLDHCYDAIAKVFEK